MALASRLRSTAKRLSWLAKPMPLAAALGLALLGIFLWEYAIHPEWFGRYSQKEPAPSQDVGLSELTPEEQAAIADIDNLTLLLGELGVDSSGIPNIQVLPEASPEDTNPLLPEALALAEPTSPDGVTASASPFAEYLEQYQFSRELPELNNPLPTFDNLTNFGSSTQNQFGNQPSTSRTFNPLAAALENRQLPTDRPSTNSDISLEDEMRSQQAPGVSSDDVLGIDADTDPFTIPEASNYQRNTIPGVTFPIVPTTPQMSPPPGTTGYTPPATLELMPPLPKRDATGVLPTPGTPILPDRRSGVPDFSATSRSTSSETFQTGTNSRYVAPYTSTTPMPAVPMQSAEAPAPFSAPRPPGSYTGGGYINTFSNPASLSN